MHLKEFYHLTVQPKNTIKEALLVIDKGGVKIALVTDSSYTLLGTLGDGDIRRAILKGHSLEEEISEIYHREPITCRLNSSREAINSLAKSNHISQIPVVNEKGQVVGLEILGDLYADSRRPNRVVLMAGGAGKRLRPLTGNTPKPMLHIGDKPILETIIENFRKYGFHNVTICVNYKSEVIKGYFGSGKKLGVNIDYIEEKQKLGTAGSLFNLKGKCDEPFFVMNADILTNVNFQHLLDYHVSRKSFATMCVQKYEIQVPYGVVEISRPMGNIAGIKEKPVYDFFVNAGIYVLSPECLKYISDGEEYDMPRLFQEVINDNHEALPFPIREYWMDIGQIDDFEKAQSDYEHVFQRDDPQ